MLQSVARLALLAALGLALPPAPAEAAEWEYGLPTNWRFDYFGDFGTVDYPDQSDHSSLYVETTAGARYQLGLSPDWALTFGGDASWQLPTLLSEAEDRELGSATAWGLRGFAGVNYADVLEVGLGFVGRDVTGETYDGGDPLWGGAGLLTTPAIRAGLHFGDSEVALFATGVFTLGEAEEGAAHFSESLLRAGLMSGNLGGGFAVHDWSYAPGPETGGRTIGGSGISLFLTVRFDAGPSRGRYPLAQPAAAPHAAGRDAPDSATDLYKKARRHIERGEYEAAAGTMRDFVRVAPPSSPAGKRYLPNLVETARRAAEGHLERAEYEAMASAFGSVVVDGSPLVQRQAAALVEPAMAASLAHLERGDEVEQAGSAAGVAGGLFLVAGDAHQEELASRLGTLCSEKAMAFLDGGRPNEAYVVIQAFHAVTRREAPKGDDRYVGPMGQRAYDVLQAGLANGESLKAYYAYRLFDFVKPPVSTLGPERLAIATGLLEREELHTPENLQEIIQLLDLAKSELAEAGVWQAELHRSYAAFQLVRFDFVDRMGEQFDGPAAAEALTSAKGWRQVMAKAAPHVAGGEAKVGEVDAALDEMQGQFDAAKVKLERAHQARYATAKARADLLSAKAAAKEGVRLYDAGDYWSAAPFLEKAAAAEHPEGLLYLGRLYSRSAVWRRDCKEADALFRRAKAAGARAERCSQHEDPWRFW